jgi:hypothetical protein
MKLKHGLIIFAIGFCLNIIGSLFKILHYSSANIFLITGSSIMVIGVLMLLFRLIAHPQTKDFLNK